MWLTLLGWIGYWCTTRFPYRDFDCHEHFIVRYYKDGSRWEVIDKQALKAAKDVS